MEAIISRGQDPGGKATGRDISRKSPARCRLLPPHDSAQQISGSKPIFRSIVSPATEEVGANVPFDPVTIAHKPVVRAIVDEAIRHAAGRTAPEIVTWRRGCR